MVLVLTKDIVGGAPLTAAAAAVLERERPSCVFLRCGNLKNQRSYQAPNQVCVDRSLTVSSNPRSSVW